MGPQIFLLWYENLFIENALRGLKIKGKLRENTGRSHRIFTPDKLDLTFRTLNYCAKFDSNRIKIAIVKVLTDRMTEWQNDKSDFIICPMLCYSNGTENKGTATRHFSAKLS